MSVHISWDINYLKKHTTLGEHSNIVYELEWECQGINTTGIVTFQHFMGKVNLDTSDLSNPIPYESLTKDVVVGWAKSSPDVDVEYVEGYIMEGMTVDDPIPDAITTFPWD
tara:strand:- start:36 stop:368 length:333 start_codon:yes stop_codon:yes gene_type:complete